MCKHRCNRLHMQLHMILFFWSEWPIFMTHLPLLWIWHDIYNIVHSPFERIYGSARLIHSKVKVFRNLKSRTGLKTNTWNKHLIWKLILRIHKEFKKYAEGGCQAFWGRWRVFLLQGPSSSTLFELHFQNALKILYIKLARSFLQWYLVNRYVQIYFLVWKPSRYAS